MVDLFRRTPTTGQLSTEERLLMNSVMIDVPKYQMSILGLVVLVAHVPRV